MIKFKRLGRFLRVFGDALIVILLSLFQTSFIAAMPWPFNYFNIVLSALIFITVIINFGRALWFGLFSGLILDLFSSVGFGSVTASLLFSAIIIDILFRNFFTNRSFYSLVILGLIGGALYNLFLLILNFCFFVVGAGNNFGNFFSRANLLGLGTQIVFNTIFLAIAFFVYNFLSKKLKSVFIEMN